MTELLRCVSLIRCVSLTIALYQVYKSIILYNDKLNIWTNTNIFTMINLLVELMVHIFVAYQMPILIIVVEIITNPYIKGLFTNPNLDHEINSEQ